MLEADAQVGGLARTEVRDGFRFDLGGHRFFTKSREVERLWHEVLGDELRLTPRLSRIHYRGRFLDYPLNGRDVVRKLGPVELARALGSYAAATVRPKGEEETFEQWVSNRFGRRLYEMFFASYTEKVWGVPCSELRAEWAAQRIKGLSFASAARSAVFGQGGREVRSLIEEFHYPRFGPGQMWEAMRDRIEAHGGEVRTETPALALRLGGGRVTEVDTGGESLPCAAGRLLSAAGRRATPGRAGAGARSCSTPRAASATATSSPWPWSSTTPIRSRTTGSTSTSRRCAWRGSRTTARGVPRWSRTERGRASGSSTSASRATSCGPWTTRTWSRSRPTSSSVWASPRARASSTGTSCACRRRTPSTTPSTRIGWRSSGAGSTGSPTSSRSAATASTATTTPTTRC